MRRFRRASVLSDDSDVVILTEMASQIKPNQTKPNPRCILGRGKPLDPGAGCPIPHFGDADGGVFFFVELPH